MRRRFDPQLTLGQTPIEEVGLPARSRDEVPAVLAGLQWIFRTPELNEAVFELLESRVVGDKKATGRPGMDLWHILVLGVVRLARGCDYDQLEHTANFDTLVRAIMGLPTGADTLAGDGAHFHQKTLSDNVCHLDADLLAEINALVVEHGLPEVVKKKGAAGAGAPDLRLKTDSYVLETDVHYPTDCNLLWDAARKSTDLSARLAGDLGVGGWRKSGDWKRRLKGALRHLDRTAYRGGRDKADALAAAARNYLSIAGEIGDKVARTLAVPAALTPLQAARRLSLDYFHGHLIKHIDLVRRRLLEGESIPHSEKVFSLFEPHTEMIKKGKRMPPVEFGHRLMITSAAGGFIVDYRVIGGEAAEVRPLADRLDRSIGLGRVASMSFDQGFSDMAVREELGDRIGGGEGGVIMPKKGPPSAVSREREGAPGWRAQKDAHAAVESDINALEHHGLDRCPDRGEGGYHRYVGLGVLSYNLHKVGRAILDREAHGPRQRRAA